MNRMWGAPRAPPWGWIARSPDQKPEGLDAILRGAGGLQGLACSYENVPGEAYAEAAASESTGLSPI